MQDQPHYAVYLINLTAVPSSFSLEPPQSFGILVPQSDNSIDDVSSFLQQFHANVVIRSNKTKVSLPSIANLGVIRPQTSADHDEFQDVADHTAYQLASSWLKIAEAMSNNHFCSSFQQKQFIDNDFCFLLDRMVPVKLMCHIPI